VFVRGITCRSRACRQWPIESPGTDGSPTGSTAAGSAAAAQARSSAAAPRRSRLLRPRLPHWDSRPICRATPIQYSPRLA
jgi:hypothetical protein